MSDEDSELVEAETPTNTNDDIPIDNGSFEYKIDYEITARMRLDLAVSNITKFAAISDFDDEADAQKKLWGAYYKEIKSLIESSKFEDACDIQTP